MADDKTAKGLDRSQPHGQIFGDDQGRIWEQGGRYFHGDGSPWKPLGERTTEAKASRATAPSASAALPANDQLAQQLKG